MLCEPGIVWKSKYIKVGFYFHIYSIKGSTGSQNLEPFFICHQKQIIYMAKVLIVDHRERKLISDVIPGKGKKELTEHEKNLIILLLYTNQCNEAVHYSWCSLCDYEVTTGVPDTQTITRRVSSYPSDVTAQFGTSFIILDIIGDILN